MTVKTSVCGLLLWAGLSLPALAHHSYSMFDRGKTLVLVGAVKSLDRVTPHSWLQVAVAEGDTGAGVWSIEMGPPGTLLRDGWAPGSVQPGDRVTAKIHPMRDGSHAGQLVNLRLADGRTLGGGGPEGER